MLAGLFMGVLVAATPVTLDEVRSRSRENLSSLAAALEAERAALGVTQARSGLLPGVSVSAGAGLQYNGPREEYYTAPDGSVAPLRIEESNYGFYRLNLNVRQLIYDGAVWARLSEAGATAEAAKGQAREERDASELEGIRRFYNLYRAQEKLRVIQQSVERSERQVAVAESLYNAGRGAWSDVLNARIDLGNDRIRVIAHQTELVNAQADLSVWLRMKGTTELVAQDPGLPEELVLAETGLDDAVQKAEANRPLLRVIEKQLEASRARRSAARASFLPRVSVNGSYSRGAPYADLFFARWGLQNSLSAGLQVEWDLFNGMNDWAATEIAQTGIREAELTLEQTRRDIEADIRKAWVAMRRLAETAELSKVNRDTAKESLAAINERFAAGLATQLEVRDAELKLTDAELILVESRLDVEVAKATLERVIGTLSGGTRS